MAYTLVASAALAFVNVKTMPRIKLNKIKTENAARSEVLPDMTGGYELIGEGSNFPYWTWYSDA